MLNGTRNGPYFSRLRVQERAFHAGICRPCVVRVSTCLYLQSLASELFRGLFPNRGEVVLDNCQNQCFRKSSAFETPKRFFAICRSKVVFFGEVVPKVCPEKIVFFALRFSFGCLHALLKIARNCDISFGGLRAVLVPLAKCIQIPSFVVYSSPLPLWGWGKFWGQSGRF